MSVSALLGGLSAKAGTNRSLRSLIAQVIQTSIVMGEFALEADNPPKHALHKDGALFASITWCENGIWQEDSKNIITRLLSSGLSV